MCVCACVQEVAKRSTTYKSTEEAQNEEDDDEVEEENVILQQVRSFGLLCFRNMKLLSSAPTTGHGRHR